MTASTAPQLRHALAVPQPFGASATCTVEALPRAHPEELASVVAADPVEEALIRREHLPMTVEDQRRPVHDLQERLHHHIALDLSSGRRDLLVARPFPGRELGGCIYAHDTTCHQ